ncbi:MAG: hypothetical protein LN590_03265 [Rickettsia endosymbiont of Glossina mortisans submortisans]|nr:hypothetical protein [Rickettsia endosymbiont of Glossina mortisans submortisans]
MPQSIKQELIELLLTEPVSNREVTNQGNYVEVINRARPQGFAKKFALLLEETPTIHSPLESEFFLHFFLGSVLTLPNTGLMSKLNIEAILFKLDKIDKENYKSVKLVFKIREQNYYQLKFIIINTSTDGSNIGFTGEELAEIKSKMGKLEVFSVDGQILDVVKDKGFKLKVLDEQSHKSFGISSSSSTNSNFVQVKKDIVASIKLNEAEDKILKDFEPLLDHLSDNVLSNVQQAAKESFALLKKIYQHYAKVLGTSESAYHGSIYGFFRLNYKYKYALDCYVERIAGKGYADIMLLSRKISDNKDKVKSDDNNTKDQDKKQFIPVIVEVKARTGADIAIEQINKSGYIYNLPNIRTNAKEAVIVGIDFNTKAKADNSNNNRVVNELTVKSTEIKKFEQSLLSQLVQDIVQSQANIESITRHIQDQIKHLYYSSIRSKDHHYLSKVLLGEVFTLKNDAIKRHVFIYDKQGQLDPIGDKVTTIILQQDNTAKGIILNIIEGSDNHQTRFRSNNQDRIFDQNKIIPVKQLGIKDAVIVNIAVNPRAEFFANKLGNSYLISESIRIENIRADEFVAKAKYSGRFQEIAPILIDDLIKSIYGNADSSLDSDDLDKSPVKKKPKKLVKELQEILSESLKGIKELIKQEVDVQIIITGMLMDQILANGKHLKTFAEITFGSGRGDLAIFIIDENFYEDRPIIIECKYGSNAIITDQQIQGYIKYLKHATEHKQAVGITLILDPSKENRLVQVKKSLVKIDHTSHSSHHEENIAVQAAGKKQKHKKQFKNSDLEFLRNIDVNIDDEVFLDLSAKTNNRILSEDNFNDLLGFLEQNKILSLLKIRLSLAGNTISQYKQVDRLFELLEKNIAINSLDLSNTGIDKTYSHKLITTLVAKENLIYYESLSLADQVYILKSIKLSSSADKIFDSNLLSKLNDLSLQDISADRYGTAVMDLLQEVHKGIISTIKDLDISNNKLDLESVKILSHGLAKLDGIKAINLSSNPIGNAELESITLALQQNYSLQVLKLSNIDITSISNNLLEILREHRSITELDISNNNLDSSETAKLLKALTLRAEQGGIEQDGILKLNLSGNKITGTALEELKKFIATGSVLKELNISNTGLGDDGLKYVVDGLNNNQKYLNLLLDISANKISQADILFEHLNPSKHKNQVVSSLISANNGISKVQELSEALMTNKKLQYIDLSNNKITYSAVGEIFDVLHAWDDDSSGIKSKFTGNKVVNTLILNGNPIEMSWQDVDSTNALINMLRNNDGLSHLGFAGLNIDDNCLTKIIDNLQENTGLESIDLSHNKIEFIDLDLSDNPTLGKEFIHKLIDIIRKDKYPIEKLKLANNKWSKELTQQLIDSIVNNKERKVDIDLFGNEISPSAQSKLNNHQAKLRLGILENNDVITRSDLQDISIIQACLPSTSRHKRGLNECKIGWGDVDKISNMQTRNSDELVIDSKKFLEYSKQHIEDEVKSLQLVRLAEEVKSKGAGKIVGKYQGLLEHVIQDQGYKNYLRQERIHDIGHHVIARDSYGISPELKLKLINAAGKIQLICGVHGMMVSCQDEIGSNCVLSVSGLGYSFLSQHIESMMVKAVPRMINNAGDVVSHIVPRILSYDTKLVVKAFGGKYGIKLAKGGAGAIASIFDIVDIGISAHALIECNKRADSNNACSAKEIRDNIASISFAGVSFVSGVALTVMGAGPAAVGVGLIIMVGQGIYSGISNIIEYEEKYDTTHAENWSIFWRTLLLTRMSLDVEHLAARDKLLNDIVQDAWQRLSNSEEAIVAYAIGLGQEEVKSFSQCSSVVGFAPHGVIHTRCSRYVNYNIKSAYSKIDLSNRAADTLKLSRVLPKFIANATLICLPKITEADYEQGMSQSRADAVYECDNAVVMVHNQRKQYVPIKDKYIIYDLRYVNSGSIIGSNELNNIFQSFQGEAHIFASSNLKNIFNILDSRYHGKIYLSDNSSNVINVSNLSDDLISMEYTHIYPLTMNMSIVSDNSKSHIYSRSKNVEVRYIGRLNKVDKIVCKQFLYQRGSNIKDDDGEHNNIIIDSGGGIDRVRKDKIEDCNKLIVSPNTKVTGSYGNYLMYIKSKDYIKYYTEQQATSLIDVLGKATIIFPEISLLEDGTKIKYDTINNDLVIKFPLGHNGWYKLFLSNYLQNDHNTTYVLIDKYGSNIVPRLDKLKANNDVKDFAIYSYIGRRVQQAEILDYYKKVTYTKYNIFTTLRNQNNELLKFGSKGNDIIINDDNTIFMSGREGADVYVITQIKYLELYISNESQDLEPDILKMPLRLPAIAITRDDFALVLDIVLGIKIIILDYFIGREHQHIALMDVDNNLYIPLELEEEIRLVPFCHKSLSQNVFILTSNVGHAVIDIDKDNIVLYKQGSDLLITEKKADSLNIILKDYYQDKQHRLETKLYRYDGESSRINLHNMEISEISCQEQYDNVIKEYVVDLSKQSYSINHNYILYNDNKQLVNYPITVEPRNERLGLVIFKNTPFKRLVIFDDVSGLILQDKLTNNSLIIGYWRNNSKYQISMFEFDNGLVASERINVSNKTIDRIKLNNAIDREIDKLDNNIVKAVIDYLKLSCSKYNEQNILSEKLRYNFLEEELNYRVGDSNNQNSNLAGVRKYLNSANNISGEAFMWLVFKSYNELLLKYPDIEQQALHKIDDSCFGTVLSSSMIKKMIECINTHTNNNFLRFKQFMDNNKNKIQNIITKLATSHIGLDHHHGEDNRGGHHSDNKHVQGQYRQRRDVENEKKIVSDNDATMLEFQDNVAVMSSSSGGSVKPIGYNIIKWIKENIWKSINLNPIEQIMNLFNVDYVKEQVKIHDIDVSENVRHANNKNQQDDLVKKLSIIRSIEAQIAALEESKIAETKLLKALNQKLNVVGQDYQYKYDKQKEYEEELSNSLLTLQISKVDIQKQDAAISQIAITKEINNEIEKIKQAIQENEQLNSDYFHAIATVKEMVLHGDITELFYEDCIRYLEQKIKSCEEEEIRLTDALQALEQQQEEYNTLESIVEERLLRKIEALNTQEKKILQEEEELASTYSSNQDQELKADQLKDQIKLQESKIESVKKRLDELYNNLATLNTSDSNLAGHEDLSYLHETVDTNNDTAYQVSSWVNSGINLINLSNGFIGNNTYQDQVFDYSSLDFQGNLLLLNLLMHQKNGIKYNYGNKTIITNDLNAEYDQNLAYSSYIPNAEETKEDIGLLGASDVYNIG